MLSNLWQTTVQFPFAVNLTVYIILVVIALGLLYFIFRRGRAASFVMRWTTQDILILAIIGVLLEVYDNLIGDQFITPIITLLPGGDVLHDLALNDIPYMFLLMVGIALIRKPGVATALVFLNFLLMQLLYPGDKSSVLWWPYGIYQGVLVDVYIVLRGPRILEDDFSRWIDVGVSIPQMVQVAGALPDVFQGSTPLSVDEVYEALRGSTYAQALKQRNEATQGTNVHMLVSPAAQSILSWEAVDLAYGPKQVLNAINLKILPEEWVAVIGANGSGKTSMASLAMGFQAPTRGAVRFRDQVVQAGKISRQAESIAYLFQAADNMLFGATVEKEFLFGFKHQADKNKAVAVTIDRLIETIDLRKHRNDNPFHLSHGQRKRLAIGVLLTRQPEVLILDEPTTGQDEGHARAFFQFLQYLRENARYTYMMITHEMRAVASYASRVVVLRDGHVFMDGMPEFIFARKDELALCGILPPPLAQLHGRLCEGRARRVDLSVGTFLQSMRPVEVTS